MKHIGIHVSHWPVVDAASQDVVVRRVLHEEGDVILFDGGAGPETILSNDPTFRGYRDAPQLSWFELSKLDGGAKVRFVEDFDIFPDCVVPAGTLATVTENGLNEIWCRIALLPDNEPVRVALKEWGGHIHLGDHLDPGADTQKNETEAAHAWFSLSPLAIAE